MSNDVEGNPETEYKEILKFRKHNDTILMSEVSILTALTSGLLYAYGQYYGQLISIGIAFVGLISTICFLFLMQLMVLGAEARDKRARCIEQDKLKFKHMQSVRGYIDSKFPLKTRGKARWVIKWYGILLIILWGVLLFISIRSN